MDKEIIKENTFSYLDLCVLAVLILCGLVLYSPSLHSTFFYFQDHNYIENGDVIKQVDIPKLFNAFNTRFLVGLSFALNYKWLGPHLAGYRLVNILIHCLNAFLVYLLIKSTLFLNSARKPILVSRLKWASFLGSILFLCHLIQLQNINSIVERFVLMASFFYLLTLLLYIQYRCRSQKRYLFAAMGSAVAAVFCKEFTATLPLMITLYDFYFLPKETIGKRCKSLLPFFLIVLIIPIQLIRMPQETLGIANIAEVDYVREGDTQKIVKHVDITRDRASIGHKEYFLTELSVMCTYVRLLFWPMDDRIPAHYPISKKMDGKTALAGLFLLCLLAIAGLTYRSHRIVSFGILWFFIALSVESSFIPIGNVINEYRVYLASVGFVLLVMTLIYMIRWDIKLLNAVVVIILINFSMVTYQRDKFMNGEICFLYNDILINPSHRASDYLLKGLTWSRMGNRVQAISDYKEAIELNPASAEAYYNLGFAYYKQGNLAQADFDYKKAVELKPVYARVDYSHLPYKRW